MESAQATLTEYLKDYVILSKDVLLSRTWSYPILGITYLVTHPVLYKSVAPLILKAAMISVGITAGLFFFTYFPQVAFCALFSGPLAFLTAAVMVLSEAYLLVSIVGKAFFVVSIQDRLFDAVLLQRGNQKLVEQGREIRSTSSGFKIIGKSLTKPLGRLSKDGILRYLISLPLNSIPVFGTAFFLLYNGAKSGPGYHARYFQLKNYDKTAREEYVEKRRGAYTAFGATALALSVVPLAGFLFNITSTIGAALWADNLEKKEASIHGTGRHVQKEGQFNDIQEAKDADEIQVEM